MDTSQEFTVRKRICTAAEGYQFITSGFPNRSRCITEYRPRSVERGEDSTTRGDQERLGVYRAVAGPRPLPRHRGGVGLPRVGSSREN